MIRVSAKSTIFRLIENHPPLQNVLNQLGFDQIVIPAMLNTVGRIVTLEQGCKIKHIKLEDVASIFSQHGYTLLESNPKENTNDSV